MNIRERFTKHPGLIGETYFQHGLFAFKHALYLIKTAIILFIHGLFPFFFQTTSSRRIEQLWLLLQSRKPFLKNQPKILSYIGNTPLLPCHHFNQNPKVSLFLKCEFFNPTLSTKDRIVVHMLQNYEEKGLLNKTQTIYEASSGNTGTSLAMIGTLMGYKVVITVPEKTSTEKIKTMRFYGAKVIICSGDVATNSPEHYTNKALLLAQTDPHGLYFNQYHSEENVKAHYLTTAQELFDQIQGQIDYIILGASSGGTVSGIGRFFKQYSPSTQIILADPVGSILYAHFYKLPEISSAYKTEGVGKENICEIVDFSVIDKVIQFSDEEAYKAVQEFAKTEGFLLGGSSGGALAVYQKLIHKLGDEKINIVVIAPDSGFKYLSKLSENE
jgi:cystathionine beta-synthase